MQLFRDRPLFAVNDYGMIRYAVYLVFPGCVEIREERASLKVNNLALRQS
jgi:hypothetical protein